MCSSKELALAVTENKIFKSFQNSIYSSIVSETSQKLERLLFSLVVYVAELQYFDLIAKVFTVGISCFLRFWCSNINQK